MRHRLRRAATLALACLLLVACEDKRSPPKPTVTGCALCAAAAAATPLAAV